MTFPEVIIPLIAEIEVDGSFEVITSDVRGITAPGGGIRLMSGRQDEQNVSQPAKGELALQHRTGRYDTLNPRSDLFGKIPIGSKIRIRVDDARIATVDQIRLLHEFTAFPPIWEKTGTDVWVPVITSNVLQRMTEGNQQSESALRSYYLGFEDRLVSYLPLEEPSENFNIANNLVPVTNPAEYTTGAAPDFPRRPNWGADDTCPGSAPLPEWPVISYFGWSRGSSVAPHEPPWQIHITYRVPEGQGDIYLAEWRTNGTFQDWQLRVNASGNLFLDIEGNLLSFVGGTNPFVINDGLWHTLVLVGRATFQIDGVTPSINVTAISRGISDSREVASAGNIGSVTAIRPRPMYVSTAGDPPPIGLGHMAVIQGLTAPSDPPTNGFNKERPADRVSRLGAENNVNVEIIDAYPEAASYRDSAFHVGSVQEASYNLDAPVLESGDGLVIFQFSYGGSGSLADLTTPTGGLPWSELDSVSSGTSDHAKIWWKIAGTAEPAQYGLAQPADSFGIAIIASVKNIDLALTPRSEMDLLAGAGQGVRALKVETLTDRDFDLRCGSGFFLQGEEDITTLDPPAFFTLREQVKEPSGIISYATLATRQMRNESAIDSVENPPNSGHYLFSVNGGEFQPRIGCTVLFASRTNEFASQRMGIQQIKPLIEQFRDAEAVSQGLLFETRNDFGVSLATLPSLYNYTPALTLDYSASHLTDPFLPIIDRQLLHNDVTVQDAGGASARAVLQEGPNSVQPPPDGAGRFDKGTITLNVSSPTQLSPSANWILHLRTVNEHRFPMVNVQLERQPFFNDPALFAAVTAINVGQVIRINNPPDWLPPGPLDLLVVGRTEEHEQYGFKFSWNTVPASVYNVALPFENGGLTLDTRAASPEYAFTPDTAVLDITGDLQLVFDGTLPNWGVSPDSQTLISKYRTFDNQRSYWLQILSNGRLRFQWAPDGTSGTILNETADADTPLDSGRLAVRCTFVADDGGGNRNVTFETAPTKDGPWTQLGTIQTNTASSLFSGSADLIVGAFTDNAVTAGEAAKLNGTVHAIEVWDGISGSGGTLVADPVFSDQADGTTMFTDDAGLSWTIVDGEITQEAAKARRDTADSETLTAFTSGTDTTVEVATRLGPRWTTDVDHFPFEIKSEGVVLQVDNIEPVVSDEFTRSESNGWGTSTSGHTWSIVQGDATGFSVNGTQGIQQDILSPGDYPVIELAYDTDFIELVCQFTAAPSGLTFFGLAINIDSVNGNWYEFLHDSDGDMSIWRVDNGILNQLIGPFPGPTFVANDIYNMRVKSRNGLHRFKVWNDTEVEPARWQRSIVDTLYTSGNPGVLSDMANTTDTVAFDNFQVVQPQLFTVQQTPVNGIDKVIPIGSKIGIHPPAVRALRGAEK